MLDLHNRSRRKFLMNLAKAGVLLPFASQLMGQKAYAAGTAKNILFLYKANGHVQNGWNPTQNGAISGTGELSFALAPVKAWNSKLIVLKNIQTSTRPDGSGPTGGHSDGINGCLTGNLDDSSAPSIDHIIARKLKELDSSAPAEVLNLGVRTSKDANKIISKGFNVARKPPQNNPRAVMELLKSKMNVVPLSPLEKSIYDAVLTDFDDLASAALEATRGTKIDEHKNILTRLKNRINFGSGSYEFNPNTEADTTQDAAPNAAQMLQFPRLCRAQIDNVVGAFANGLTRVATLQIAAGDEHAGYVKFAFDECLAMNQLASQQLGWSLDSDDKWNLGHTASHETHNAANHGQIRWHYSLLDYALTQLNAQGILDETLVVMFSEVGDHAHYSANSSIVVAGGANGGLQMGRVIDCNHNLNTLQLYGDIARHMGVSAVGYPWRSGLI